MGRGKRNARSKGSATAQLGSAPRAVVEKLEHPPRSGVARDPSLVVLVGVSGGGKDTLIKLASDARPLRKPISATSRPPREGERDGVDYHFFDREGFMARVEAGEMFEWAEFNGNCYGTLLSELEGSGVKLTIKENQGAKELKERLGGIVVGVFPPSLDEAAERMLARGDDPEDVARRIAIDKARAEEILEFADYIVTNDDLDETSGRFIELLDELASGEQA